MISNRLLTMSFTHTKNVDIPYIKWMSMHGWTACCDYLEKSETWPSKAHGIDFRRFSLLGKSGKVRTKASPIVDNSSFKSILDRWFKVLIATKKEKPKQKSLKRCFSNLCAIRLRHHHRLIEFRKLLLAANGIRANPSRVCSHIRCRRQGNAVGLIQHGLRRVVEHINWMHYYYYYYYTHYTHIYWRI